MDSSGCLRVGSTPDYAHGHNHQHGSDCEGGHDHAHGHSHEHGSDCEGGHDHAHGHDHGDVEELPFEQVMLKVEEAKAKGNDLFKSASFVAARAEYDSGIGLLKRHDTVLAAVKLATTLHSNIAMCALKEESWDLAVKSCDEALSLDPSNLKALYRRGVAHGRLGDFVKGKADLQRVTTLDRDGGSESIAATKEMNDLIRREKEYLKQEKAKFSSMFASGKGGMYADKEAELKKKQAKAREREDYLNDEYTKKKMALRREKGDDFVEPTFEEFKDEFEKGEKEAAAAKAKEAESGQTVRSASSKISKPAESSSSSDDDEETKDIFKGYKRTADGRTTTYFNRELDETAKQLLKGTTAPKPLGSLENVSSPSFSSLGTSSVAAADNGASVSASTWNTAGTWEEREMSSYATERLKTLCLQASYNTYASDPSPVNILASITEAKKCEGEAQIILARGRKRHVFDYTITLNFVVEVNSVEREGQKSSSGTEADATISKKFKGTIDFSEVTGSGEAFNHNIRFSKEIAPGFATSVRAAAEKLALEGVASKIKEFEVEFRSI